MATIDEQLHLVVPVDRDDGTVVYVHAAPIGRECFQRYWLPMSKAFNAIYAEGLGVVTGPRIAALMLRKVATESGVWDGPMGVEQGLIAEVHRLANVVVPGGGSNGHKRAGWQMIPFADAVRDGLIDENDSEEIEGILVFFTLAWRLHRRTDRKIVVDGAASLWGASTSSLSLSAFVASLPTWNGTDNTGATAPVPSSQPSSTGPAMLGSSNASGSGPTTSRGAPLPNSVSGS